MSVGETVERPMRALKVVEGDKRKERVKEILESVGLSGYEWNLPSELSGGQRQRVAIARALSVNPQLVIFDEPTSALDVSIQAQVVNLLKEIEDRFETTFILITHNIGLIRYLTLETAVMYRGKLMEIANTRTLLSNPLHPYTKRLLDSVPVPDPKAQHPSPETRKVLAAPSSPSIGCPYSDRCPYVMDRCKVEDPKFSEPEPGHKVACFLFSS